MKSSGFGISIATLLASIGLFAFPAPSYAAACSGGTDFTSTGDGTNSDPYEIATASDLIYLSANQATLRTSYFVQTANIDLSGCDFTPIGTFAAPFSGNYDGNSKLISGLVIAQTSTGSGLFGALTGTVQKLGLVSVTSTGSSDEVGAMVGRMSAGTLSQVYATGTISADEQVGGLVGMLNGGTISDSWTNVSITATNRAGGFVGSKGVGTMLRNYSIGPISSLGFNVGGFQGDQMIFMAAVNDNYYNTTTSLRNTSQGAVGLSSSEFRVRANFDGWDFATPTWKINSLANEGFPYLAWQNIVPKVASTVGTDFWTTFGRSAGASTLFEIYLSSTLDANATIHYPDGTTQAVALLAGVTKTVDITSRLGSYINTVAEGVTSNGVRITSDNPISVYGIDWKDSSTDAWTSIPTSALGYEYMANIPPSGASVQGASSNISVIATEPGVTQVTVTPTVNLVGGRTAGAAYTVNLNQGQVYKATVANAVDDISGTKIVANRKVAVINSSYMCCTPQGTTGAYDQTFEQLIPMETWGTEYLVARGATNYQADTLKVVAREANTSVYRNGSPIATLNAGQAFQFAATNTGARADVITSDKPISLVHVTTGSGSYNIPGGTNDTSVSGDPAVAAIPAINQYLNSYVVTTPSRNFPINYATLIVKQSEKSLVTRGGYAIGASSFTDIPGSSYAVARVYLTIGTHYFRAPSGFMLQVAGYDDTDSYSYPGGMGLVDPVAYPNGVPELEALQSPTKPVSIGGDSISGTPNRCSVISVSEGSWLDGRSAILSTGYQWYRNGLPISGATTSSLDLSAMTVGDLISYEIRKTNALGTTSAFSTPIRVVDNLLSNLSSSVGTLSPAFDPCVTSYTINVIQNWVAFTASAPEQTTLKLGSATILTDQASSAQTLTLGANTRAITATRSGITQTYNITINYTAGPTVSIQPVTNLNVNSVTVNASVNANGNALTGASFEYATLADFSNSQTATPSYSTSTGTQTLTSNLSGLLGAQRYYLRASVTNSVGTVVSQVFEFTTKAAPTISSITAARDSSVATELDLSATVNPNGSSTQLIARYSLNADFSGAQDVNLGLPATGTSTTTRSGSITGLPKGALVYYQLRVENQYGSNFGPISTFQMRAAADFGNPTITAGSTTARVEFPVNPHSTPTDLVCISHSSSSSVSAGCSEATWATPMVMDGNEYQTAVINLTGLTPSTTYYVKAIARNYPFPPSLQTAYSGTYSFTTSAAASLTSNLQGPAAVGANDAILLTFRFSEAITGFDKTDVALSGATSGWTTQPVYEVEPGLYIMEIRPTGSVTAPSTLTVSAATPGTSSTGAAFPAVSPINIAVVATAPSISYAGSPFSLNQFQAMSTASVTNSGGVAATFTSNPALPAGLTINNQGQISGTPVTAQAAANYTITATNSIGSAQTVISIAVAANGLQTPTISYPQSSYSFQIGQAISAITPSLGGGSATSISVSPALPTGLALNPSTGVISGTPTSFSTTKNYLFTASNAAGSSSYTIRLATFETAPTITFAQTSFELTQFSSISPIVPTNSGGPAYYSLASGSLPSGLILNSTTGAISGTPGGTRLAINQATPTSVVIRASNSAGVVDTTLTFRILAAVPNVTYAARTINVRSTMSTVNPVLASDSGAVTSYSISPALPAGLTLNTASGAISGAPTEIPGSPNFTITATNAAGSSTTPWTLTVNNVTPAFTYSTTSYVGNEQQAFTTVTPTVSAGANITFAISPALPSGLSISSSTGIITGTPAVGSVQAATTYTVTGSNSSGSYNRTVSIRITNVPVMAFTYPSATLSVTEGSPLASQTPTVTAGSPTTWSISPALPAGLSFSTSTGAISGTPSRGARQLSTSYLITGGDGVSSNTFQVSVTVSALPIAFSYAANALSLEENLALAPSAPIAANGSILPLSFSISPSLPQGLNFDTTTGAISGTPAVGSEQVLTTYTITGTDGALTETTTVTIEIAAAQVVNVVVTPVLADALGGPFIRALSKPIARAGESIAAFGHTLATVSYLEVAGVRIEVADLTDERFAFDLPSGLKPGRYDLVVYSSYGKLTVQDALKIEPASSNFWTKRFDGQVKIYAKNIAASGKVQFFVNGREVAWIRTSDANDPRLLSTALDHYFVRTRELASGKNRFEIKVAGKRVWFVTYASK